VRRREAAGLASAPDPTEDTTDSGRGRSAVGARCGFGRGGAAADLVCLALHLKRASCPSQVGTRRETDHPLEERSPAQEEGAGATQSSFAATLTARDAKLPLTGLRTRGPAPTRLPFAADVERASSRSAAAHDHGKLV
jgi:hypothetical protein